MGFPHDAKAVLDLIEKGSFVPQDVAKVTALEHSGSCDRPASGVPGPFTYMLNIGGAGLDAAVCSRVNLQKSQGKRNRLIYVWSLLNCLLHCRPSPLRGSVTALSFMKDSAFPLHSV